MEYKTIGGHTFAPELLGDGCIIDVGCRGFEFTKYFCKTEYPMIRKIHCIDPDPSVFSGHWENEYHCINLAISDKAGDSEYYENGEATCLKQLHHFQDHRIKPCKTITMEDLYKITGENVDILKLDCEGAEYIILGETFKPIPKQLTVEYHFHCVPELHNKCYPAIKERLSKHYEIINETWEARHGCGGNFWDVLYIRKDLIK